MMLEVMQYSAAALWIIAALLWVRNQIRIKKATAITPHLRGSEKTTMCSS